MNTITQGVKLDADTRKRLKICADQLDRTAHWCMKLAIAQLIEKVENGARINDLLETTQLDKDTIKHSVSLQKIRQDKLQL